MAVFYLTDPSGDRVAFGGDVVAEGRIPLNIGTGTLPFFTADIEMSRAASIAPVIAYGHATAAHSTFSLLTYPTEDTAVLTVSDTGYRTDGAEPVAYPPTIEQAFSLEARLPAGPG